MSDDPPILEIKEKDESQEDSQEELTQEEDENENEFTKEPGSETNKDAEKKEENIQPIVSPQSPILEQEQQSKPPEKRKKGVSLASAEDVIVPIRLDIQIDDHRSLKDTFLWNLTEPNMTPELFAQILCEDLDLSPTFEVYVVDSIRQQLQKFKPRRFYSRENIVTIRLDITVNGLSLRDQFQWDLNNPNNSPEIFARVLSADLALSREFQVSIAHSIREQIAQYTLAGGGNSHFGALGLINALRTERELSRWSPVLGSGMLPYQPPTIPSRLPRSKRAKGESNALEGIPGPRHPITGRLLYSDDN